MPIFCPECKDAACCDHCFHYDFNGDSEGRYIGNGWCNKHKEKTMPYDYCDDYHCFLKAKEKII